MFYSIFFAAMVRQAHHERLGILFPLTLSLSKGLERKQATTKIKNNRRQK